MTAETVLIAALSGRGLAHPPGAPAICRWSPMRSVISIRPSTPPPRAASPTASRIGFRAKPLFAALDDLAASARHSADRPRSRLRLRGSPQAHRRAVAAAIGCIGNDAADYQPAQEPHRASSRCSTSWASPHPETRLTPPDDRDGWLTKRIGGSGGTHIVAAALCSAAPRRYFQRLLDGEPFSVLPSPSATACKSSALTRQWTVGIGPRPYRYGGAVGPVDCHPPSTPPCARPSSESAPPLIWSASSLSTSCSRAAPLICWSQSAARRLARRVRR